MEFNVAFYQIVFRNPFLIPGRKSLQRKPLHKMGNHSMGGSTARGGELQGAKGIGLKALMSGNPGGFPKQGRDEGGAAQSLAGQRLGEESTANLLRNTL